jgi:hypothetical protein
METLSKIPCGHCSVEFEPYRSHQKFCSSKCRQKSYFNENPEKKRAYEKANRLKHKEKRSQADRKRRLKSLEYIQQIKLENGCNKCGYKGHAAALDFNHLDPAQKSFNISSYLNSSREILDKEIAKCEVLCANCHRIHTYETHTTRMGTT